MIIQFHKYNKTFHLNVNHIVEIFINDEQNHCEMTVANGNTYHFKDAEALAIWNIWVGVVTPVLGDVYVISGS